MKKFSTRSLLIIAGIIFAAVLLGMFFIRDKSIITDVTARTNKVGLIITGPKDDANFCQAHYDALMNIKDELNLEIICKDQIPEDETCADVLEELAESGCKVIIGASFGYGDYIVSAAEKHPEICYLHPFGAEKSTNLASCMGRMYQARYLSGIVAGMRTETGEIGYVAAFPFSEVIRDINAFALGVQSVSPDTEVYVTYCYSWTDDDAADKAGRELLERHPDIDVFSMHTNSLMPNRLADEKGIWSVGYNMDNSSMFPDSFLTACEWNWDLYYRQKILSALQGKFYGQIDWMDIDSGLFGISELTDNAVPGTEDKVEAAKERFASRSFDVFYGPITDNLGTLRIPDKESMSDDDILNHFDWYVEGVTVEE